MALLELLREFECSSPTEMLSAPNVEKGSLVIQEENKRTTESKVEIQNSGGVMAHFITPLVL